MLQGPKQFLKLPFPNKTHHLYCHEQLPFLLRTSSYSYHNYNLQKQIDVKQIKLQAQIQQIKGISHSRGNLLYYSPNYLHINDCRLHLHQGEIVKAIADDFGVVITCGVDQQIKITSVIKQQILASFNFHYHPITDMFWHNSLAITGDKGGQVCLWDINKCQQITHRKVHYEAIDYLGVFVDYTINNLYYTANKQEKRLILSDLRTNKPIRIIANLHSSDIVSIKHNNSGKIFVAYNDIIDVVDLYNQYKIVGNFSPILTGKQTSMRITKSNKLTLDNIRKIVDIQIMNKYVIAACSNGSIQVYDTDSLECLYGFGIGKVGPLTKLQVRSKSNEIYCVDGEGDVYMAKF